MLTISFLIFAGGLITVFVQRKNRIASNLLFVKPVLLVVLRFKRVSSEVIS